MPVAEKNASYAFRGEGEVTVIARRDIHVCRQVDGVYEYGVLDRGELLALEPVDQLMARYGASTLEEAFFAATGRTFEDEGGDDDDDEREVFA